MAALLFPTRSSRLEEFTKLPIKWFAGLRYGVVSPDDVGLIGLGARAGMAILFPAR